MKIAIVGAGISGLVAAHLLQREHEIVVFEAGDYAGGHANTVRVDTPYETHHVDTGFVVFNDRNYPYFGRLLETLRVRWQPSNMSFSVSDAVGQFEYASTSPNGLYATRANLLAPSFHRMVAEVRRFQSAARELLRVDDDGPSLLDWLEQQRFSRAFIERLIVPQAAAVWSADPRQLWSFPARFLVQFFHNHGMLSLRGRPHWRTVAGGSARYVEALTAPFRDRLRLCTRVIALRRADDHVLVSTACPEPERFDRVVLATHADQALPLLREPTYHEREVLGALPYQRNEAVLHTDVRMLPRRRRAWASWNYHLLEEPTGYPTLTYHMNRLQGLRAEREFCVTLNHTERIDPARIIKRIPYAHPVYTPDGVRAQARIREISGQAGVHFCGAYCGWGFHEDGVVSAHRVAAELGVRT